MNAKQKNILNVTWKVGLGLIGSVALLLGVLATMNWHYETYGRCWWENRTISGIVTVHSFNDDMVRVWNEETERYTTPKLRWVSSTPLRDSLTVFCDRRGRRGFLNVENGEIVIPGQYVKAWHFSEGIAAVMGKNRKIGFIGHDNQKIIDCSIPYEEGFDYIFKDGFCVVPRWDNEKSIYLYAVYDKQGEMVLPWEYTEITDPNEQGYRIARNTEGAWLYDREFDLVFHEAYEDMDLARGNDGVYLTRNHVKQFVDYSGKIIEPFVIDSTYPLKYVVKYHEDEENEYELVQDVAVYSVGSWEGLLDLKTGKPLTPPIYWTFEMISKDWIEARLGCGSESVILDRRGAVVRK